jgi:toxin YoeB
MRCAGSWGLRKKPEGERGADGPRQPRLCVMQDAFREDLLHWIGTDRKVALRLMRLIEETVRDPFTGIGKPEPLRHVLAGCWSRRLTDEHRVVYQVTDTTIHFLQARLHY